MLTCPWYRISATDWLEESLPGEPSWTSADTVKLAGILAEHGVDFIDVSSGGLHPAQKFARDPSTPAYQARFAEAVKKEYGIDTPGGLFVGAVGEINTGPIAEDVLQRGMSDVVLIARQFQRDPAVVLTYANQLGVSIKVANQIEWGMRGRGKRPTHTAAKHESGLKN